MKKRRLKMKKRSKKDQKFNKKTKKNPVQRLQLNLKNHQNYCKTFSVYPMRYLGLFINQNDLFISIIELITRTRKEVLTSRKRKK